MEKKGTVTELSSLFPAEEAQKASMRVQDAIAERRQQLDQLKGFVDDNINLINLVQRLPDETHHNIMVPFGKAAFFPGRLIHTNEFMVLLGEGYYAERTSKQTIEILKRRGKALESQIESLKAIMQDLKAEASFFDSTAHESAEGLVEIREDYVEEDSSGTSPMEGYRKSYTVSTHEVDGGKATVEDDEYARIFARMAELEKEEEEAEGAEEEDEKPEEDEAENTEESNGGDDDVDEQIQNEQGSSIRQFSSDQEVRSSPVKTSEVPAVSKEAPVRGDYPALGNSEMNKASELTQEEKKIQSPFSASNMAFTGSIVEHPPSIGVNLPEQQTGVRSSKPVSRFRMQRK